MYIIVDSINNSDSSIHFNIPNDLPPNVKEQIKQVEKKFRIRIFKSI